MTMPISMSNDFYLEVVRGNVEGFSTKEIIGSVPAVAETCDVFTASESSHKTITFASAGALLYVSSSDAGDTAQSVTIVGLDDNYDVITETIDLNGQTCVAGTKAFLRVNEVTLSATCSGKVYVFYNSAVSSGVPTDLSKVQSVVLAGALQAYNAIYTVPRNRNLYLTSVRYQSTGSTTAHDVVLSITRTLYGASAETLKTIKYVDLGNTNYTDGQVDFSDQPIFFPAKSIFKVQAGLSGGTAMALDFMANFIEEEIDTTPTTVTVIDKAAYLAKLAGLSRTLSSQNYWLIGLDELPSSPPTSVNLVDVLCTITGTTGYKVASNTDVVFDPAYYVSGKLISTTKRAIVTIMRCVDSGGSVDYVLAPDNTIIDLGSGTKRTTKVQYLA